MKEPSQIPSQPFFKRLRRKGWQSGIFISLVFGYFLFGLTLKLEFWMAISATVFLTSIITSFIELSAFPGLDRQSPNLQVKPGAARSWFCGECQRTFLAEFWLVGTQYSEPVYVAQCPFCKGGNTRWASAEDEEESEKVSDGKLGATCKICGAPPFSLACHRNTEAREKFWKG